MLTKTWCFYFILLDIFSLFFYIWLLVCFFDQRGTDMELCMLLSSISAQNGYTYPDISMLDTEPNGGHVQLLQLELGFQQSNLLYRLLQIQNEVGYTVEEAPTSLCIRCKECERFDCGATHLIWP